MAKEYLDIPDASVGDFAACHRLTNRSGAAIIARFVDLDVRNLWLSRAKKLARYPGRVSISPDLPPILRDVKQELLRKRANLDQEKKRQSYVKHLKTFPYVQLEIRGQQAVKPQITLESLAKKFLNVDPNVNFSL